MTCGGCGCALTRETKYKDRLLCHPCYLKWWKDYWNRRYPVGSIRRRAFHFNRNRPGAYLKESDLESLIASQARKCKTCGDNLSDTKWEIDHITPVSAGGTNNLSNLQILCKRCNRAKDNGSMDSFTDWVTRIANRLRKKEDSAFWQSTGIDPDRIIGP